MRRLVALPLLAFSLLACKTAPQQGAVAPATAAFECPDPSASDAAVAGLRELALSAGASSVEITAPPSVSGIAPMKPYTRQEIDSLVSEIVSAAVVPADGDTLEPMRFDQFRNDCEDRAHVAAAITLRNRPGLQVGKVFVSKGLRPFNGAMRWLYHVAPYVVQVDENGLAKELLVIDPAMKTNRALPLAEWVAASAGDAAAQTRLHFVPATVWNFDGEMPEDAPVFDNQRSYCGDVTKAATNLAAFDQNAFNVATLLHGVRVSEIDRNGFVTFAGERTYGPFLVRPELLDELEKHRKENTLLEVRRQRLYGTNRLVNIGLWLRNDLEVVQEVKPSTEKPGAEQDVLAERLIREFHQDTGTNCATLALAKLLLFRNGGQDIVGKKPVDGSKVELTLPDGSKHIVTQEELQLVKRLAGLKTNEGGEAWADQAVLLAAGMAKTLTANGLVSRQNKTRIIAAGELDFQAAAERLMTGGLHTRDLPPLAGLRDGEWKEMTSQDGNRFTFADVRRFFAVHRWVNGNGAGGCVVFSKGHAWFYATGLADFWGKTRRWGKGGWAHATPSNALCLQERPAP